MHVGSRQQDQLPAVAWAAAEIADMHLQYFNYIMHVDSQTQV